MRLANQVGPRVDLASPEHGGLFRRLRLGEGGDAEARAVKRAIEQSCMQVSVRPPRFSPAGLFAFQPVTDSCDALSVGQMHGTFLEVRAVYRVANQAVASEYRRTVRQLHAPDEGRLVRFRLTPA